jgi:uncharacterized protein YdeI (YjbR/CyaY-like superfamily)
VKVAMTLNENGVKVERKKTRPKTPVAMHPDFKRGLAKSPKAKAGFEGLPPGQQREYVEWIAQAKKDETRARRLAQALEWLADGKPRNWKYHELLTRFRPPSAIVNASRSLHRKTS